MMMMMMMMINSLVYLRKYYGTNACGAEQTTDTYNCFIIRSPSLFFNEYFRRKRSDLPFLRKSDHKNEKSVVSFAHEQFLYIICSQTQLDNIAHWRTIICRQLFVGHVVGCRPMKRKKILNLHRMIIQ